MVWIYQGAEFTDEMIGKHIGFVYLITNLSNGRMYIGKKLFSFAATKQVNGKRKRFRKESDWKVYHGSNIDLQLDVNALGADNFKREIIYLCLTKGEANYLEAREQMDRRVLETDDYYNGQIQCRINSNHLGRLKPKQLMID